MFISLVLFWTMYTTLFMTLRHSLHFFSIILDYIHDSFYDIMTFFHFFDIILDYIHDSIYDNMPLVSFLEHTPLQLNRILPSRNCEKIFGQMQISILVLAFHHGYRHYQYQHQHQLIRHHRQLPEKKLI